MSLKSVNSDVVIGYAAYFELINGFRKTVYWTKAQVEKHKKKFSKSDVGWKNDCDAMAPKFPSLQTKKIQKTKRARSRSF
ncbi:hypothetical protein Bamy01_24770 [Bacillus amyloliquefaciens]|nr:hypothetical protein B425_2245 [Bacillus amyloliquefaciens]GLW42832.1 hypothetical protein Bamy01_24770 [Bacillus amyloliquefaciens]